METTIKEGLAIVKRISDNKYNFITANGKLLFEKWFVWVGSFYDGFARVERDDFKYNYIGEDGKILSEKWFEWAEDFCNGFAVVLHRRQRLSA